MHLHENSQRSSEHSIFDFVFSIAAVVIAVVMTFSALILGIFGTDSGSPAVTVGALCIILAGPMVLFLIIVARLAANACPAGKRRGRTAKWITVAIYSVGGPALMFGAWQCVRFLIPTPEYQEATTEIVNALPTY
jgi:Na+-driven multidrug efflux pump